VEQDAGTALIYPSTGQSCTCYIEILSFPHTARFEEFFRTIEREWLALGGRPNWPKLQFATERIRGSYPAGRIDAFLAVRDQHDPNGVFLNDYAREILGR
jgi:FAD/FMN-containing dehydrogenase